MTSIQIKDESKWNKFSQARRDRFFKSMILLSVFFVFIFTGCVLRIRDIYEQVYLPFDELRSSVYSEKSHEIEEMGKIYIKDNYIFVNEIEKGIHVIDISNPAQPEAISFINIPGNVDISILGSILYADSYIDLVAIDISNIGEVEEVYRIENAFPDVCYYTDAGIYLGAEKVGSKLYWSGIVETGIPAPEAAPVNSSGTGGSMARFTIVNNYLLAIKGVSLDVFSLVNPSIPSWYSEVLVAWDIETIFPVSERNLLFIGSQRGMYIYDISNMDRIMEVSEFSHATSCDPVVVQDNLAYVTLRSGNGCGGGNNDLIIVDITNLWRPFEVDRYTMKNPFGLGIDENNLFICDGEAGLKIFDTSYIHDLKLIQHFPGFTSYDVILQDGISYVVGPEVIHLYDYSDINNILKLSDIKQD